MESNDNQEVSTQTHAAPVVDITNNQQMAMIEQFANTMAGGKSTIPQHLAGSPADCMAVTMQAMRWGMDPFVVAQKTHLVSGNLGYEAQLVNSVITSSTAIDGRFHYEYSEGPWIVNNKKHVNESDWVRVGAKLAGEDEITWGEKLYPASVSTKNSPLWDQSGAGVKQQAAYLALKYWARLYTPHVIMGVYTPEELTEKRELKEINPGGSALNIPDKKETVDTSTGEVLEGGQQEAPGFDDIMQAMVSSETIEDLNSASLGVSGIDKESEDYQNLYSFFLEKKAKLLADAAEQE